MPIPISECRFIRLRDAPRYLGMSLRVFNEIVRPCVTPMPIGKQGVGFDREELDRWADTYKQRFEQPGQEHRRLDPMLLKARTKEKKLTSFASKANSQQAQDVFEKVVQQIYAGRRKQKANLVDKR